MLARTALLCGLAAIFVSAVIATDEPLLKEYVKRQIVIQKLNATYDEYRGTYPQHKEERKRLLKHFVELFQTNFDDSDGWLLKSLSSEDGVVEEFTESNGFDFVKTTAFLSSASHLYVDASLQRIRYEIYLGNYTEAERLESTIDAGAKKLKAKSSATLDYIRTTAYRAQFKVDVQSLAKLNIASIQLPDIVVRQLKNKFPFRSWVAVLLNPSKESALCTKENVFVTSAGSRRLMVFDVAASAQSNRRLAAQLMNRVENNRGAGLHSCENRAKDILHQEAKYKCAQKAFHVAGAVEIEDGLPRFASTNSQLLSSKQVWRARLTWICSAYFEVFFLA